MVYRVLLGGRCAAFPRAAAALRNDSVSRFLVDFVEWEHLADAADRHRPHLLILDATSDPPASALAWLAGRKCGSATIAVVDACNTVAELLDLVDDFVIADGDFGDELRHRALRLMAAATDLDAVAARLGEEMALRQLVGNDPAFVEVLRQITLYGRSETPVLIIGETGTGKELCARALHHLGPRRNFPFLAADCSALPDHLFENEVFGHARGAYTDAAADQKGLVALAEHGTLFLDEIDSLSLSAQGKLLRFLQERTYKPLGGEKLVRANINVLAASNRDLHLSMRSKDFRADLFYRLDVLEIRMPPLRERRGDIPLLARHFLDVAAGRVGRKRNFAAATLRKLAAYDWPGNVRELANVVQRAAVMSEAELVLPCHVVLPDGAPSGEMKTSFRAARSLTLETFERAYVQTMLEKHGGNVTHAAREAGQERRAFGRLAKKYKLS
jgi:two-component system response regulator GlrR